MELMVSCFNQGIHWLCSYPVLTTLAVGGGGGGLAYYYLVKRAPSLRRPASAEVVGKVSRVDLFPVKATRALAGQDSVLCDRMGLKSDDGRYIRDRSWMITNERGAPMRSRAEPRLALIQPSLTRDGEYLKLDAPGMPTLKVSTSLTQHNSPTLRVSVWRVYSEAVHCGEEASKWICKFLGKEGFILVYHPPCMKGRQTNKGWLIFQKSFTDEDLIAFAEIAPVHIMTESSVKDLQSQIGSDGDKVTVTNFRPSLCIEGSLPYDEDNWDRIYIEDEVVFENKCLVGRCLVTCVDHEHGTKPDKKEPLITLKRYRPNIMGFPCIGLFVNVLKSGRVKVGDTVYATRKKPTKEAL